MPSLPVSPFRSLAAASISAVLACSSASFAGAIPNVEMTIQVSDGTDTTFNPLGSDAGSGNYGYVGMQAGAGWTVSWDFLARDEPSHALGALIGTGYQIQNNTLAPLEFFLKVTLPLNHQAGAPSQFFGGVSFTLTGEGTGIGGADPSYAQSPAAGDAMWTGLMNDAALPATTLFTHPSFLEVVGQDSDSSSQNIVPGANGSLDSIGASVHVILTPGEILTVTGNFVVIPAPAAFALLGMGLLGARRRRRD